LTGSDRGSDHLDLRPTISEGSSRLEKLKDKVRQRRGSIDSTSRRLSVTFPGRRRSKQKDTDGTQDKALVAAQPPGGGAGDGLNPFGTSKSEDSLGHAGSISSSLLTEDSDPGQYVLFLFHSRVLCFVSLQFPGERAARLEGRSLHKLSLPPSASPARLLQRSAHRKWPAG
jgi:hypothetical protein